MRPPSGSMHLLAYLPSADAEPLATRIREIGDYRGEPQPARSSSGSTSSATRSTGTTSRGARAAGSAGRTSQLRSSTPGHVRRSQEAFDRLLADGQPAYVDAGSLGPEEAVELVASSGGAPVLAHPYTLRLGDAALERFVERLAGTGCEASSASVPITTTPSARSPQRLCAQLGLVPTGGSDWHGNPEMPELGDSGPVPVPDDTLERLGLA